MWRVWVTELSVGRWVHMWVSVEGGRFRGPVGRYVCTWVSVCKSYILG